ncbi:Glycine/D-amino acid oxidase [Desulfonispora thiosulfatigenes DSM 11270]|uniref:Glycine/D-amino acid oxidase n=1 Tax=Desulfonispora thiosulfatigenes DSM 11270 TaxID=656914 RepID=A0A1W1UIS5_DESTI|nr:FAD-dependent oxidoreductase [Desulfonispora thiosulfatigenes]SMB80939.1 Glycine/D-amino acid oxidase [Desulfonispora thiosulfatigenes DSM 11270]
MNLVSGNMLWTSIDKIPNKYSYLSEDIECDVLVIGAGITGAIAAHYLNQAGVKTVMVDKNIIGYGSTRASTSILQYEIDIDLYGLKSMIGEDKAAKCFKLCENAVYEIEKIINNLEEDCDFSLEESLYYTNNASQVSYLKKEFDLRKKHGLDVKFLDKEQAKEKFSFPIEAGIYSNSGAASINPYRFTHALISKEVKNGLKVFENTEIIKISPQDKYVNLETNNNYKIKAKKVIIAAGYEGKDYIHGKIADMSRTFTIVTKPIKNFAGWNNKCIIRDDNDPYIYLRTTGDNRIIIGGEDEELGKDTSKIANLSNDDIAATLKYDSLLKKLKSYFPLIDDIEVEYKFSGIFAVTKDGLPYIGEYQHMPNCYFSLGYGSNGILYAIIAGQLIRDLYSNKERSEYELFSFTR